MKRSRWVVILTVILLCAVLFFCLRRAGPLPDRDRLLQYLGIAAKEHTDADALLELSFLAVGQGDCALVQSENYAALIDAGLGESYDAISAALDARGITELDAVFISHPHTDHMGALRALLRSYSVKQLYFADIPLELTPTSSTYERLLDEIAVSDVPVEILHTGEQLSIPVAHKEEDAEKPVMGTFTVLWSGEGSDLNNCSMVLRLQLGNTAALFMGDAEQEAEKALLARRAELQAQILKVGHHGTKYATTEEFLAAVKPQFAVVSCGKDNEYGYPKEEVVQRIAEAGAGLYRTDTMGDITFCMDGSRIWLKSESGAEDAE